MLKAGPAKKVSIYVGEDHQYHGQSLYSVILDFLFYRGISGANVVRGIAGFGADHHLHLSLIHIYRPTREADSVHSSRARPRPCGRAYSLTPRRQRCDACAR